MRRAAWWTALLAAVLAFGACGDDDGGGGGPDRVRVQDTAGVPSAFLQYGVEEGFFEKRDLNVEVTPSQGGATVVPSVVSETVDIGGSNLVSVLLARGEDIPVQIVAPGTFVQADRKGDFSAIVVAGDGDIRSPADLEGKSLAINTLKNVAEVTAKASLEKRDVDVSRVELAEIDFPDMLPALEQGRVDAAFAIEPFVTQALEAGHRVIDRPYVGTRPGLQIGCYFASERYVEENGDVIQRFREGVGETADAIRSEPAAFRRFLTEVAELPAPVAERIVLPEWKATSDRGSLDEMATLMVRYGVAEEKPDTSDVLAE
jgi:NitT/TauT family transport system substrate-binding protein